MDTKLAIAIGLLTLFYLITIYLIVELKSGTKKEKVKTRKSDRNLDEMADRLQHLISNLGSEVSRDQMVQEKTTNKVSPWVKLKRNTITTLSNNRISAIEITVALIWMIISFVVALTIIPGLGPFVSMVLILIASITIFNIMNVLSMWKVSRLMKEAYVFVEQNTNHYHRARNFVVSVENTIQSMPANSKTKSALELFVSKMLLMGNYPMDRAIDELKTDLGHIRYVDIYLDRVKAAETVDTRYKNTISGISELFNKTVISYADFTQAMIVGLLFITVVTIVTMVLLFKMTITVLTADVVGDVSILNRVSFYGAVGVLVGHLIFFFSTQPQQERKWGGEDSGK